MIREGLVAQIETVEKIILNMEHELLHDGSKAKEKMFSDQDESRVFYKLYEVYTEPTGLDIGKLLSVRSGVVRLYFDYRDDTGLIEMNDRDYATLWPFKDFRKAVESVKKIGVHI